MSKVIKIQIAKQIPFSGPGDSLETRLSAVTLRGFNNVRIYENATFSYEFLTTDQIEAQLHTPQPNIYRDNIERLDTIDRLFLDKGINIFNLEHAYDFSAINDAGEITDWTMIPPVVEAWNIPQDKEGHLNYEPLIGSELTAFLESKKLGLNPEVLTLPKMGCSTNIKLINDGAHRIYRGWQKGGAKILVIDNITPGYPYYAAPQKYNVSTLLHGPDETSTAMKIHIVESPGQKSLYRSFPSGGIKTGEVRPPTKNEVFI